jgi:hypothetical protein
MRVVVCGRGAADPRSSLWTHVMGSLRHLGHEVVGLDPTSPGRSGIVRGSAVDALESVLTRFEPEMLVHVPTPGDIDASDIRRLTAASETVSMALHTSTSFGDAVTCVADAEEHLLDYDLVSVPDPSAYARLAPVGDYRVSCLEAATHTVALDAAVTTERRGVVIVGEPDERGAAIVRAIVGAGVEVSLFGAGWSLHPDLEPLSFPRLSHPDQATVLAGAELLVELPTPLVTLSQARISAWEAPVSQCVLDAAAVATPSLTMDRPAVHGVFRATSAEGSAGVAVYECDADVATLVTLLMSDTESLRSMGEAASDVVRADHSWTQRWETLFGPFECPDDDGEYVMLRSVTTAAAPVAVTV